MSPFNESKRALRVVTKRWALPLVVHHLKGFWGFQDLWCRTDDNYLVVLMQKSIMLYES
jgi:hypothetical protein